MRYALVGASHPHLPAWIEAAHSLGVEVPAVYDPDPGLASATAAGLQAEAVGMDELTRGAVDGALVIAKNDLQYDLARKCVERSLPTMVEKTGAQTQAQFGELIDLANQSGVPIQVAYYLRYSDSVRFAKDLLNRGDLGRVALARFHVGMPRIAWDQHGDWFRNRDLVTSLFTEEACHVLDIVFELFGQPSSVSAKAKIGLYDNSVGGVGEDSLAAILDYDRHLVYLDFVALEANPWLESWDLQIYGSDASLRGGLLPAWTHLVRRGGWWEDVGLPVSTSVAEFDSALASNMSVCLQRALSEFVKVSRGEQAPPVDVVQGSRVAACIDAIHDAVRTGTSVLMPVAAAKPTTAR